MASSIPPETQDEIVRLYTTEKLTMRAIGARFHWSEGAVLNVLTERGIPRNPTGRYRRVKGARFTSEDDQRFVELYQGGVSASEIARRIGTTHDTITYRLRRAGVEIRTRGEACRIRHRNRIANQGRAALNERQQKALDLIEARGEVTTAELAAALSTNTHQAKISVQLLVDAGIVTRERAKKGRRPYIWRRTNLPLRDVLHVTLAAEDWGGAWLPVQPFREWVGDLIDRERRKVILSAVTVEQRKADATGAVSPMRIVAGMLGVDERRLHAVLYEQKNISLRVADLALQNAGTGTRLEDLWPELGREDELDPEFYRKRGYGQAAA